MKTKQKLFIYQDTKLSLIKRGQQILNNFLSRNRKLPKLILCSGGSSIELFDTFSTPFLSDETTISLGDDRFSTKVCESNFHRLIQTEFYQQARRQKCKVIETFPTTSESLLEVMERMEEELRAWRRQNPLGVILATLGMGTDGHIAGIMPFSEDPQLFSSLFENEKHWVVGYDAGQKNSIPLRVTITFPLILQIDFALLFVLGESKQEILKKALFAEQNLPSLPASIIQSLKKVVVLTNCTSL